MKTIGTKKKISIEEIEQAEMKAAVKIFKWVANKFV